MIQKDTVADADLPSGCGEEADGKGQAGVRGRHAAKGEEHDGRARGREQDHGGGGRGRHVGQHAHLQHQRALPGFCFALQRLGLGLG